MSASTEEGRRNRFTVAAVCGLLLLAVITVFGQTAGHEFVNFDDRDYVYDNLDVRGGLTGHGVVWAITPHACNWHPLTWLSHMLDCQIYKLRPGGHHLTNVLLHAAAAIFLFLALVRMTAAAWPSAWVAAVFAIHPLRVESVAWVAERKDVLSGLCFMVTLWLYAGYVRRPASWARYLAVVASFALGLTAKPMLVTLPFVLLLLDYWPLRRIAAGRVGPASLSEHRPIMIGTERSNGGPALAGGELVPPYGHLTQSTIVPLGKRDLLALLVEKIPLFVLAAFSCVVTLVAQRRAMHALALTFPCRVANAAVAYVAYLGKMFYPSGLALLYPHPEQSPPTPELITTFAVLIAVSIAAFLFRRKCPYLLFGWLWYLGTLVPVIGLVQVGYQALADRYTYLTQIGLYAAIAWGAMDMARSWPYRRWAFAALSALLVAGMMVCAWQQTHYWHDSETLWTRTLDCTRQNAIAHHSLGNYLTDRGKNAEAVAEYRAALKIMPDYAPSHANLGFALAAQGRAGEAIEHYRRALEIEPRFVTAYVNLGLVLASIGHYDEAVAHCRKALEIEPGFVTARVNLGIALAGRGQTDEAIGQYRKALEIDPQNVQALNSLGTALGRRGQTDEAIAQFRKALEIQPESAEIHFNLGFALADRREVDEAVAHYQKALDIDPKFVRAHVSLGLLLADRGQVEEAIAHYRTALELRPDYADAHYFLGKALAGQGHVDEAAAQFQKALKIQPGHAEARRSLDGLRGGKK